MSGNYWVNSLCWNMLIGGRLRANFRLKKISCSTLTIPGLMVKAFSFFYYRMYLHSIAISSKIDYCSCKKLYFALRSSDLHRIKAPVEIKWYYKWGRKLFQHRKRKQKVQDTDFFIATVKVHATCMLHLSRLFHTVIFLMIYFSV